jgi:hypothetical protein
MVRNPFSGEENRFSRAQPTAPVVFGGGGSSS